MFLLFKIIIIVILTSVTVNADGSPEYVLHTKSLPEDLNFMPSLANGHLGYTVFGESIFMVGVYNGGAGESRRARIPNWINITATVCNKFDCMSKADVSTDGVTYEMDLKDGYFRYRQTYSTLGVTLEQRTYPHRYYTRALVYEVVATRHDTVALQGFGTRAVSPMYIKLKQSPGEASDALTFTVINNGSKSGEYRMLLGRTKAVEFEQFQNTSREIFVLLSENFEEDIQIEWPSWQPEFRYQVFVVADIKESVAIKEMEDVQNLTPTELLNSHISAWNEFWNTNFAVEVENDLDLWQTINAGVFYLASSMPSLKSNQENLPFYGLSPTGLARGNLDADYQGHSFWDTEIWMLPVISQFSYTWAKEILNYRYRLLSGAQYNAYSRGFKGARFPWESAYTGTEVTNNCCPEVAQQEIHISSDIVFALEKYFAMTNDRVWLCEVAWPIVHEVADFLLSRVSCWDLLNVCHLLNVMGPDEDHSNIDDNVYTNVISKKALEFADFVGSMCGNETHEEQRKKWKNIADQLLILYDKEDDYHPQHSGYKQGAVVKQADTILLGYPLRFNMDRSTRLNDLKTYAAVTRETGPAMTWSMFALNYLQTDEDWRAQEYFERGYKSYVRPEFKVWSETPIGQPGSSNFLTGIGGFLQTLISGYGAIDYARDGAKSVFLNGQSNLPNNITKIVIKFVRFTKSTCMLTLTSSSTNLNCFQFDGKLEGTKGNQSKIYENGILETKTAKETLIIKTV